MVRLTISSNYLQIRVVLFDVPNHVDLEYGIALGRILEKKYSTDFFEITKKDNVTVVLQNLNATKIDCQDPHQDLVT